MMEKSNKINSFFFYMVWFAFFSLFIRFWRLDPASGRRQIIRIMQMTPSEIVDGWTAQKKKKHIETRSALMTLSKTQ